MEKIIESLEKDLINIIEGKSPEVLRTELGDKVDVRLLRILVFALQWTSVGYQSSLRLAGMKFGKGIGASFEKTELSLIMEAIKKIIEVFNHGKVEIEMMPGLKELRGAQLRIYESSTAWGVPNISQKLCFFEEGFIEGFIDGVISKRGPITIVGKEGGVKEVNVQEKNCVGLGDEFCNFLIKVK